jgi:hypothetical protein
MGWERQTMPVHTLKLAACVCCYVKEFSTDFAQVPLRLQLYVSYVLVKLGFELLQTDKITKRKYKVMITLRLQFCFPISISHRSDNSLMSSRQEIPQVWQMHDVMKIK